MKRFIEGADRNQITIFPERLEDCVAEDNPVRVVDAFVDQLDLLRLGFSRVDPSVTGRPSYHPTVPLKLYIHGYLNRVRSSRRLEREAARNVEVMWLTGRLVPDHKTIADFRRDNGVAILPKPMTSGGKAKGRFVKADFRYLAQDDVYICPAGEPLKYRFTTEEKGLLLRRYWTSSCGTCAIKDRCTTGVQRRITRWEHEHLLEDVQRRLDENPRAMRQRRETVEHPFGTIKARMGPPTS